MTQPGYIVKHELHDGSFRYEQRYLKGVRFPHKYRKIGTLHVGGGFGDVDRVEQTAQINRSYMLLQTSFTEDHYGDWHDTVKPTAFDVEQKIRRLRPEHAKHLDELDAEIDELKELAAQWEREHPWKARTE